MTGRANAAAPIDNERVRVTQWHFAPGAGDGWHRHEYDYIVVPLTDGAIRLVGPDDDTHSDLKDRAPYFRGTIVEHDVVNARDEFTLIEIEDQALNGRWALSGTTVGTKVDQRPSCIGSIPPEFVQP